MKKHLALAALLNFLGSAALAAKHVEWTKMQANSDVMNLALRQEGDSYQLLDTAPEFPEQQLAYYINGQYFGKSLKGFSPHPGTRFTVAKLVLQPPDNPSHFWEIQPQRKAYALVAIANPDAAKNPSRQLMPPWYEDKPEYRPTKFAPKWKLIENKLNAGLLKRADVTWQDALDRAGLTHIEAEHLPPDSLFDPRQGRRYGLPSTHVFDFTGKKRGQDLTRDEVRKAAEGFGPFGLLGDQFGEGDLWFPFESHQEFWFYERAREVANDPQCTWPTIFFGTYGGFGFYHARSWKDQYGGDVLPTHEHFTKYYAQPALAAQSCSYFNRMYQLIDANVSWYAMDFNYAENFYQRVHSIQVMKLGQAQKAPERKTYLFWWNGIEYVGNGHIHNGYHWEHQTTNPLGLASYEEHPSVDLNSAIALCLIGGFIIGDGVIGWDNNIQFHPDANVIGRDQKWIPLGANTNVQRAEHYGYPAHPVSVMSAQFIAAQWYQSFARTGGAPWQYVKYRVDDGKWIVPEANGSTILMRAAEKEKNKRGVALSRVKNTSLDWVFYNPYWLPNEEHKITVEVAGHQWTQVVRGNEVVACNEIL